MALISFCGSTGKNTGGIACDARWGNPRKAFLGGAKFTPTEMASEAAFIAALNDRINRADGDSEKLYPLSLINTVTNNTEASTEETLGDGTKRTLREGRPAYTFESGFVGLNQESAIMEFNNATIPAFVLDDTGKFQGKDDSAGNFVGSTIQFFASPAGWGTYAAGTTTKMTFNYLDSRALSTNARFIETNIDPESFEGLLDAKVERVAASAGNVHKVTAVVKNKSYNKDVNLWTKYPVDLADVNLWPGTSAAGATVVPTTVVVDNTNKGFTITYPSAVVSINLASPEVLFANDITGIEGLSLTL